MATGSSTELRGGRYVLTRPLGEGSQAETFEAVDKREGRLVAVKRFRVGKAKAWKDVELAEREAKTLASLDHPLLPKYVEHFEENGELVLVMELIEGESLASLKKTGHRSDVAEIARLLDDASSALAYLHNRTPPVIHRDLKPANVIRRKDGSFAFVDFGAVRDRLKVGGGSTVVGTFGYMAPEQFQGRASGTTDVYGVGATAITMMTGVEPEELPHRGLAIDVAAAVPKGTPGWLVRTLQAMLEPNPEARAWSIAEARQRGGSHGQREQTETKKKGRRTAEAREAKEAKRAERKAEKAARKARRARRRARGPFILRMIARLGVMVAQIVAWVMGRASGWRSGDEEDLRVRVHDDVSRRVRAVTPEEAQREAMLEGEAEAEAWADERATREAERWEPPEAWRDQRLRGRGKP
jgi:hypothetical protein